jgi:hypothetical protein
VGVDSLELIKYTFCQIKSGDPQAGGVEGAAARPEAADSSIVAAIAHVTPFPKKYAHAPCPRRAVAAIAHCSYVQWL